MKVRRQRLAFLVLAAFVAILLPGRPAAAAPGDASVPGQVSVPYPTLRSLTVVWGFSADNNGNATVGVRYRASGAQTWRTAMELRRVPGGSNAGHSWPSRHTGSIVDLAPATTYQIELQLTDPDGGSTTRTVEATTRAVPKVNPSAPVRSATPATLASVRAAARPGDVIQLTAGSYAGFTWDRDGTAAAPIVLRGAEGAVIEGELALFSRKHVHLDGLTVNGRIRFNASENISITRSTIRAKATVGGGDGIVSLLPSKNAYIADNTVTGTTTWTERALGVDGDNRGEGIQVTGPGHVIVNNTVSGFRDAISLLESDEAVDQYSIDIIGNDISAAADDAIEADYCAHNCRVMRNRITNSFVGVSSQPSLGGPNYIVRNAMYNVILSAFKLHNNSAGDVVVNNTVVKNGDALGIYPGVPINRAYFANNLFIGGPGGRFNNYSSGTGRVASLDTLNTANSTMDHDAYGSTVGAFAGRIGATSFSGLDQLRARTSEKHAVQVDLDSFAAKVAYPAAPMTAYAVPDLRLAAASPAVNAGKEIAGFTDGSSGTAPDAGAYELGHPLPRYGPRPGGEDEEMRATGDGGGAPSSAAPSAAPSAAAAPPVRTGSAGPGAAVIGGAAAAVLVAVGGVAFGMWSGLLPWPHRGGRHRGRRYGRTA